MMYNIVLKSSETSKYQLAEGGVFKFSDTSNLRGSIIRRRTGYYACLKIIIREITSHNLSDPSSSLVYVE